MRNRKGANIVQRMALFYSIKQEANEVQKAFSELTYNCYVIKKNVFYWISCYKKYKIKTVDLRVFE